MRSAWQRGKAEEIASRIRERLSTALEEMDESPLTDLPKLPSGWCWVRGEQLFDWASGKNLPQKKMREGEIPVFGGNGCSGYHDEANVFESTICIGRVGAHCGNVHKTDGATWITDNAIYATLHVPSVHLGFATFAFRSLDLNQRSRGGWQPYVNQDVLNDAVIALPPLDEQAEIVELLIATKESKEDQANEMEAAGIRPDATGPIDPRESVSRRVGPAGPARRTGVRTVGTHPRYPRSCRNWE